MSSLPLDYSALVRELTHRASLCRQPVNGTFELTERCNLFCRMCYIRRKPTHINSLGTELTAAQWLDLASQAVDNGMVFLLLTGGEIFLRPDFFDIFAPLTRMGLIISLFTNGTLISEEIAARLAEAPPSRTEITVYGATADTYESVTGVPGSYDRCIAGIDALVKRGVPLALKTTITRQNVDELEAMRQMARDRGLTFSAGWLLSKRRDGLTSGVEDCRLAATECVELEATDQASASDWSETALRQAVPGSEDNFYCHAGKAAFAVNAQGEMNPCLDMTGPAARPLDIGFAAAWAELQSFIDNVPSPAATCLSCDSRAYCPRCPAWSQVETGTLTEPVPYLCEIAAARKNCYAK